MKKRLLSALLALALVFVLLPTTALASSIDPDITIAGTEYDFELENYKENTYKTVYYQHDKFLTKFEYTSDGVWATDPYLELTKTGAGNATTITITVHKGSNTTKAFEIKSAETCIATSSSYWNLVITGSGALSLTHTGTSAAIWSNHSNITITGGVTVNVKGTKSGSNINSYSNAIQCGETFTVSNGATVVAENNSTYSNGPAVKTEKFIISGDAKFEAQSAYGGKAISFDSITADGYDFMGRSGNSGSYTTLTGDDKATKLQEYSSIQITPTPTPALEKSNVYVAGTNLYKNTAYTIQNGKPVMGGTYPGNYNIYFDATDYVLHVKDANIDARGTSGIYGTSDIVFVGVNSITASTYGIYSYFKSSDLKISGTGSLNVKTIAGDPAIATAYDTSRSIIISGNDFTVTADTSGTTSYAIKSDKDLTITGGAAVTAKSNATRAIDIKGDLTVTNGSLTATSKSDSVPTVQVGGNASFTGSTVTITNNSTTQGERYKDSYEVSSALHVNGAITISGGEVTATATVGGNAIRAVGNITVSNDAIVTAKNNSQYFNAITAGKATGGEVNTLYNLIVSGENTCITATNTHDNNLTYGGAINAYIKNANEGHYLQVGTDTKAIAPNVNTTVRNNSLTITRGDEVARTESPVVIAGTTLLNDTYYTITNGSKVAEGTDSSNYNAFYDSETKTLKLNNASINGTGVKAIEANVGGYTFTIELVGNNIIKTSGFANNVIDITGNLYFTGSGTAEVSGKGTPIYATYKIDVSADVTITNTEKAGSFTFSAYGENSSNYKGANTFAIGTGYTAYATTDKTTWAVYDNTTASENESYTTLRITTQPPETGGGSTHQHTWDTTKWYSVGDDYHARKCTGCDEYDLTNKQAHYAWPDEDKGPEGHTEKCMLCDYKYDQSVIKPHEWTGWWVSDYQPEVHAQRCNCGYQGSTHRTLKYVAINSEQHQKQCPVDGCGYKIEYKTSHVYEEGSNICTECGYDKSAPCNHTGDRVYTNNGDGTHKVTCKACGATIVEKETHEFDPTGACVCGATQSGGNPTPDNPGTIVIIRPAEEEKPAQQPNPSTGANDLVGMAVAAAVVAVLGSVALLRKHD